MSIPFKFRKTIEDGYLTPAQVGTVNAPLQSADAGKSVKYGPNDNVLLCGDGDEISSFLDSVEVTVTGGGYKLGNIIEVETGTRQYAVIASGSAQAVAGVSLVVSAAQSASGTPDTLPKVKVGTPGIYRWIVRSILTGTGTAGSQVVLERV